MTTFKSFTALIFLVAHITATCMEKEHLGHCYIMISADQSNVADRLKAFGSNKPLRLNVDLVNPKTNALGETVRLSAAFMACHSFGDFFKLESTTEATATFIYARNPRLKGATLSEQIKEAQEIASADLCSKRLKQIKY